MDAARPTVAGSPTRRAAAHHRCSCCDQRDFLFAAHRLSVASSSSRVSSLGHRVSLFPYVEELRCVDMPATGNHEQVRRKAGRSACPSVVIMDGQSVKTTERGGVRGFDGHKLVKGQKRHILVDTLGLPIACQSRASQHLRPTGSRPLTRWLKPVVSRHTHRYRRCRP